MKIFITLPKIGKFKGERTLMQTTSAWQAKKKKRKKKNKKSKKKKKKKRAYSLSRQNYY